MPAAIVCLGSIPQRQDGEVVILPAFQDGGPELSSLPNDWVA